jgi:acetyl esterase/lipase
VRARRGLLLVAVAVAAGLASAPAASADLQSLKAACAPADAAPAGSGVRLPFTLCDDGVPPVGGTTPNEGAVNAVAVPERYGGDGITGLPPKAMPPDPNSGADHNGNIALDIDVSLPDPGRYPPPPGGYPLLVMMHGCCSGMRKDWERPNVDGNDPVNGTDAEGWHYSNAWFVSRGYVVLNYTARGFVSASNDGNRGSTGQAQLDDIRYEIHDYQYLAGLLADDPFFHVDPQRVVVTGGSYGGGFSWLALTDPVWTSPGGKSMRLAAAAPKYGWTDLAYSLVPNGSGKAGVPPAVDGSTSGQPMGFPKQSIVAGLYASGKTGIPPVTGRHTTFSSNVDQDFACLSSTDPFESNPLCSSLPAELQDYVRYRSAYYQNAFFAGLAAHMIAPVPVFVAGTFTDRLFTLIETRRMVDRLRAAVPGYPIEEYYGDYQHFTQNKAREWADVCGTDHHICRLSDFPSGDLNATPAHLVRTGVTTRLDRFLDHYARPPGDPGASAPAFDATADLQVCDDNAARLGLHGTDAGPQLTAPSFGQLAPDRLRVEVTGDQTTTNHAAPNVHAVHADPVNNLVSNSSKCVVESSPGGGPSAGPGVATYDSAPLPSEFTVIGQTRLAVSHAGTGSAVQLHARMYDLDPGSGQQTLVDVGLYVPSTATGTSTFDLQGNGWRFPAGHVIRLELSQDDAPYIKASNQPSSLTISRVTMDLPVREARAGAAGGVTVLRSTSPTAPGCVSGRRVVIRLRSRRRGRFVAGRVWVNGRARGALGARALRSRRVVLAGLPSGMVRVRITLRVRRSGHTRRMTVRRTYRTCRTRRQRPALRHTRRAGRGRAR